MCLDVIHCNLFATCLYLVWDISKSLSINNKWFLDSMNRNGPVTEEHTLVLPLCTLNSQEKKGISLTLGPFFIAIHGL